MVNAMSGVDPSSEPNTTCKGKLKDGGARRPSRKTQLHCANQINCNKTGGSL